jgi:NADH:ubiquinone oxidoreductase subunit 5 (subunit L)/multisubunit Na+/H+ antiporter MnhA subunit
MTHDQLFQWLGIAVIGAPALLLTALGASALVGRPLPETATSRLTQTAVMIGLLAAVGVLVLMLVTDRRLIALTLGDWIVLPGQHFHFTFKFIFDRLSVPFVILSFTLCGVTGAFASRYLHREAGFGRFFVLYAMFLLGMVVTSLAGTIETLFAGWELVGLSSALLVGFFHERSAPVRNGLRVWTVYRVADAALLIATVALHQFTGGGDFTAMMGSGPWPQGQALLTSNQAFFVGLLLLVAAAGKSALVPFSGWLPRAMEGPTPSSAIFYGALSVHLGAFLLLRVSPLMEASTLLSIVIVVVGAASAIVGALAAHVQSDVKSALAFASLTQVGIIVIEIGCGFRYLALVHMIGHACLRTLQLLRAPSLLRDYHELENAIGARLPPWPTVWQRRVPAPWRVRAYRLALERGFLDTMLDNYVVYPFVYFFQRCDALERRWTQWLAGSRGAATEAGPIAGGVFDETP